MMHADGCWRMGDGCWRMGDGCWDTTDLSCGETRGALWQHKMSVAARQDLCGGKTQGNHKGGAAAEGGRPPFVEAAEGRLPCFLPPQRSCLAATDILCCHSVHLVSPHERPVSSHVRPQSRLETIAPGLPPTSSMTVNNKPPPASIPARRSL